MSDVAADPIDDAPVSLHSSTVAEMDPLTLYKVLQLRSEVFVVEQQINAQDMDDFDVADGSLLVWAQQGDTVLSTVRVLDGPAYGLDPSWRIIGRVATAQQARGKGIAGSLMRLAIELCDGAPIDLHAQSYLRRWYESFGFAVEGDEFIEEGLPHLHMQRIV